MLHLSRYLPAIDPNIHVVFYVAANNRFVFEKQHPRLLLREVGWSRMGPCQRVIFEMYALRKHLRNDGIDVLLAVNQVVPFRLPCPAVSFVQNLLYNHFDAFQMRSPSLGWRASLRQYLRFKYYGTLNDGSLRRARRVVVVSETARREVVERSGLEENDVDVVPLAASDDLTINVNRDDAMMMTGMSNAFFLCVGAIAPYKNIEAAVEAIAQVRRLGHRVRLAVVGWDAWGYGASLRKKAAELEIDRAVRFVGPVPHSDLASWYSASRGLLLLSDCEAFPLPALEAMLCGTPVIGSNRSGVPDAVGDGGVTVDPADADGIVEQMILLLKDAHRFDELVQNGFRWVKRFSWDATARGLIASLRQAAT